MELSALATIASNHTILARLPLTTISKFFTIVNIARPTIQFTRRDTNLDEPPLELSRKLISLFAHLLGVDEICVIECWKVFREEAWREASGIEPDLAFIAEYNKAALPLDMAYHMVYPPVRACLDPTCQQYSRDQSEKTLSDPTLVKGSLFTAHSGAFPIVSTSLYCRCCRRRYYSNYFVDRKDETRQYYRGVPDIIQVSMHYFLESELLEIFATSHTFAWVSSQNSARIYNLALGKPLAHILNNAMAYGAVYDSTKASQPTFSWPYPLTLRPEDALDGFFLYSLLLYHAEEKASLTLPNNPSLSARERLRYALQDRNDAMQGVGQDDYLHACDLCYKVIKGEDGTLRKMHAAVCDGITLGHPCCGVHGCQTPLDSQRDRYCPDHRALEALCAIDDCSQPVEPGFRTCSQQGHRRLEEKYREKGTAMFQLQDRLQKARISTPSDSVPLDNPANISTNDIELDEEEALPECDGKADVGKQKLKSHFGRRWTHNEQLVMRPCGLILARGTLYGAESVASVNDILKATFPTPSSTPEHLFFDNNCKLLRHLKATNDSHFANTAMPVDVFHFKTKHKVTDSVCQEFCNPAAYPELIAGPGKWLFNSSICEQTNVWLGGFQAILRDMEGVRYNFYLDEVIRRRNRYVISELSRKGHHPWVVPYDEFFFAPIVR
ncbi:cytochrome P450 [Coprinopsis cinerea AmutBmut pab1-1]|nr:cytochrome P450 [Coprinopsis cinerea AmutBmut pab1-1]